MSNELILRLREDVVNPLKERFVERDEVVDLIALAAVAGEHLFLLGPPGTAKSALIRHFALAVRGRYFEYMLTRFSEPNEVFGPVDIARLRDGVVATVTTGMLPEAEFAFLDELFNANSAILNNLLTVLNERVFRRGAETHRLPLLSLFSASNHLPEDNALKALFDRFLLRCHVDNLRREAMPRLLRAGWELERTPPAAAVVTADDLRALAGTVFDVNLDPIRELYTEVVFKVRDLGIALSDRRAVKVLKLLAASAVLCGRTAAEPSDLWVLRYVWDRAEQIAPLRALVQGVLEQHPSPTAHPRAAAVERVDGEELARQLDALEREADAPGQFLTALARLRERLTDLTDRAAWVADEAERNHLLNRGGQLLRRLGVNMPEPLADVCLARIPAAALLPLAAVRTAPGVLAWREGDSVWLTWEAGDDAILCCVLPIPGVELFARRDDHWYRPGHSLPSFDVPDCIDGQPLAQVVTPAPLAPVDSTTETPLPVRFKLTADGVPRPTTALRCSLTELAKWADGATSRQLRAVRAALCAGDAVLLGGKLPMLPGATRFWGQSVLVPLGYRPEPNLPESTLRDALGLAVDELAILGLDGIDIIDQSVFAPLTRSAARLALRR